MANMTIVNTSQVIYGHDLTRKSTDSFALHCHPMYEVYYFLRGNVHYLVEGVAYKPQPHSLLLMASGVFHGIRILTDDPYERYTLHFDPSCLPQEQRDVLLAPFHGDSIYYTGVDRYRMADFCRAVGDCAAMDAALHEMALPLRIAALLTQVCSLKAPAASLAQPDALPLDRQIIAYINAHLTEPLTLERIARQFYISRNQLCRTFARATGSTVGAYIRQKRLILAQQLRAHGQSIAEAAANAGFGDYSTYYRTHCKVFNQPPAGAWRQPQ